jgi:hypothetical protein
MVKHFHELLARSAFLVEEEGTLSRTDRDHCRHGLFGSLYTDRGGHYFLTCKG